MNGAMRIAIDARKIDDFGIGTYIRGLVAAMCRLHPEWSFLLLGDPGHETPDWSGNVTWVAEPSGKYGLRELLVLSRRVRELRADLFHSPHYVYPLRMPCPGVVTIHDCIHLRFPEQLPRPLGVLPRRLSHSYAKWMLHHASRAARRILTVSEATAGDLVEKVGVPRGRITVVPNGCDSRFFDRSSPLGDGGPAVPARYLLFVGNAKPHKNLDRLLRAFEQVSITRPSISLLLVGSFPDRTLHAAAGTERIRVLGRVQGEFLPQLYRGAMALCLPSLYEGFGLPALEAMASGTPVIAARAGALPEVVGEAALLVDPLDVDSIAAAMERICDDERLREDLADRGPHRAREFTWQGAAEATAAEYIRALEGEVPR